MRTLWNVNARSGASIASLLSRGVEFVTFEEKDALFAAPPDLIKAWEDRQAEQGRGEEAREITAYVRGELDK